MSRYSIGSVAFTTVAILLLGCLLFRALTAASARSILLLCYFFHRLRSALTFRKEAANFLRPQEIEIVVDWVIQHLKGKGPPSYADCTDFFGAGARACENYKNEYAAGSPREATTVGK
jgi:hypothetical protein